MGEIYTACVGHYKWPDAVDVSIGTARGIGRVFAPPSWGMVMAFKRGRVGKQAYASWYLEHLRRTRETNFRAWEELLSRYRVVLTCYCPPDAFCHRKLMAQALAQEGGRYMGEIRAPEQNLRLDFEQGTPEAA
ncbi:MAG: hypothetical protein HYY13_13780 [Nitrospirae bacterium]|nr:hypothetical protein [Nitrospirota bacterium]